MPECKSVAKYAMARFWAKYTAGFGAGNTVIGYWAGSYACVPAILFMSICFTV